MTTAVQQLLDRALTLSSEEQEVLVKALIRNFDGPLPSDEEQTGIDAAWAAEIKRRMAGYRNGSAELIDADEVYASLRLRKHR